MPRLTGSRFVLAVHSLARSRDYYSKVLGFQTRDLAPGWHVYERDGVRLMVGECPDEKPAREIGDHSYFGYIDVEGIDDYFAQVKSAGAEVTKPLRDEPWGMREFGVRTIDGHRIMFGFPIAKR